jgi:hypothetical protein
LADDRCAHSQNSACPHTLQSQGIAKLNCESFEGSTSLGQPAQANVRLSAMLVMPISATNSQVVYAAPRQIVSIDVQVSQMIAENPEN